MKLMQKKPNQVVFQAEISENLANVVRKYLNEIPILAIDEADIIKNDSPLYDETIAHRLGLIPLKNEKTSGDKAIKLKLSSKKEGIVYSGELKGNIKIVYEQMPITLLNKGQEFEVSASVKPGKGTEHSKFSPGLMFYRNIFDIKIDKDCPKEVIDICPQKILKLSNEKVVVSDNTKCDMCEACVDFCRKKKKDSITITPTDKLVITLESFGQLPVDDILKKSIDALKKDISEVAKKIGK